MSKSTFFLFSILLIVLLGFLTLNYAFSNNLPFTSTLLNKFLDNKIINSSPLPEKNPQKNIYQKSSLYFYPNLQNTQEGKLAYISVILDSKGPSPTIAQLEIAFDPGALTNLDIVPGNFFTNPKVLLKNIDYNNGRISYALESTVHDYSEANRNPVAIISFMKSERAFQEETSLYFLPKTTIKTGSGTETLDETYSAKIILSDFPESSPAIIK